jgi:hypothetical protein
MAQTLSRVTSPPERVSVPYLHFTTAFLLLHAFYCILCILPHRLRAVGAAQPRRARGMRQPAFRSVSQCPAVKYSAQQ